MRRIRNKAWEVNKEHGLGDPVFSFDNATIHDMEVLEEVGITWENRVPLPPRSPDMHKVIEHVFGTLEGAMQEALHEDHSLTRGREYAALLRTLFKQRITALSIQKDIRSLYPLYDMLHKSKAEGGVEGDWPPAKFR